MEKIDQYLYNSSLNNVLAHCWSIKLLVFDDCLCKYATRYITYNINDYNTDNTVVLNLFFSSEIVKSKHIVT